MIVVHSTSHTHPLVDGEVCPDKLPDPGRERLRLLGVREGLHDLAGTQTSPVENNVSRGVGGGYTRDHTRSHDGISPSHSHPPHTEAGTNGVYQGPVIRLAEVGSLGYRG